MSGVRFALLGVLTVAAGTGHPMRVSGARQRALLAALLLSANAPVSSEALADAVWDGSPPPGAATTLRSHIRRLRQALGPLAGARITTCDPGYLILAEGAEVDVLRFEAASATAARALELWRGTPLLDVPSQMLRDQFVPRLEQMRLQVIEDRAEADLRLGHHNRLIPELRDLAAKHPMREWFHAQLMEALARAGRQAEALDAYRQARRALVDELGIEPGPHLRRLHQQILDGDPALAAQLPAPSGTPLAPTPPADPAGAPVEVPRQLLGAVPQFIGRSAELARLSQLLDQAGGQAPTTIVISAVGGTAGVGKTALALHWAHQVAGRFPGGQLYVNLRGFDPGGAPAAPAEVIQGFLNALGVPPERLPPTAAARQGLYRSLLAGRQMLLVLDNAADERQVRPLLPASPGTLVIITSRRQLGGLAADGSTRLLSLDVLSHDEAIRMLATRLGSERAAAEPDAVAEIAWLCSCLPLALAVTAARATTRPGLPLAALAGELRETSSRLDTLDADDPGSCVLTVFSWSYQQLTPGAARMFRLLGLHPGLDISAAAAASLAGLPAARACRLLGELTRAHLASEQSPGRYAFHDLLRAYAADLAIRTDNDAGQRQDNQWQDNQRQDKSGCSIITCTPPFAPQPCSTRNERRSQPENIRPVSRPST